jgi:hypothetical protein
LELKKLERSRSRKETERQTEEWEAFSATRLHLLLLLPLLPLLLLLLWLTKPTHLIRAVPALLYPPTGSTFLAPFLTMKSSERLTVSISSLC